MTTDSKTRFKEMMANQYIHNSIGKIIEKNFKESNDYIGLVITGPLYKDKHPGWENYFVPHNIHEENRLLVPAAILHSEAYNNPIIHNLVHCYIKYTDLSDEKTMMNMFIDCIELMHKAAESAIAKNIRLHQGFV